MRPTKTKTLTLTLMLALGWLLARPAALPAAEPAAEPAGETPPRATRPAGVPEGAEAWLVLPRPAESVARAVKVSEAVMPESGELARQTLEGILKRYGGDAVDLSAPLVAVIGFGEKRRFALSVALRAEADVLKALEARFGRPAALEAGISTYLEVQDGALPDKEVFAAVKAGRLVLGDERKLVEMFLAAPAPVAGAWPAELDALAGIDVKRVLAAHRAGIDEFLKKLEENPAALLPGGRGGPVPGPGLQALNGPALAGLVRGALEQTAVLDAELRVGETGTSISWGLLAAEGSNLAAVVDGVAGAKLPEVRGLPEAGKTLIAAAGSVPPEISMKLLGPFEKFLLAMAAGGPQPEGQQPGGDEPAGEAPADAEAAGKDVKALMKALAAMTEAGDGTVTELILRRSGGLCVAVTGGVRDAAALRGGAVDAVRASTGGTLAALLEKSGVKLTLEEKKRRSGELDVDGLSIEIKPPARPDMPPEVQAQMQEMQRRMVEQLYGQPAIYELALAPRKMYAAFGKEAPEVLDELVRVGQRAEGQEGDAPRPLAAALKSAPQGACVVGEVSLTEYARFWGEMMTGMAPPGAMPALEFGEAPAEPLTFWMNARDSRLELRYNVPLDPVKRIVAGVRKFFKEIRERQKALPPPPPPPPDDGGVEVF
jgi:hypothetical protein